MLKKSSILIVGMKDQKYIALPKFILYGDVLNVTNELKYQGHYLCSDLTDDRDMHPQLRKLYGQSNMLVRKFSMCSESVKIKLFQSFCSPLYMAQLW